MLSHVESAASSAVKTALDIGASAILVLSDTGETCRFVSKFHPNQLVLAVMESKRVGNQIDPPACNNVQAYNVWMGLFQCAASRAYFDN